MYQHVEQIGTFGGQVDEKINAMLARNPSWRFVTIHPMPVHRIGGNDQHVLAVFETEVTMATWRQK